MLDTDTKRRIDTARDILVGKVPDPKSQVEQITIALLYKFMDDIDADSEELGGQRKFFAGEFARYGWAKLMSAGLGGHDTLNLYAEAIGRMRENPGIPPLFRSIFENAYLPYRDPETLRAFLKVIDEFTYDHSERLGDSYEYLLSVLGTQGKLGQFRTPRHIIDFIVAIVDPQKHEIILDPACGTAGFLISAYKHILAANMDADGQTSLTPSDRQRLATSVSGYDIDPGMVRFSLMNMYLHEFTSPQIQEYDTLTSDERWSDYADVILANPPFMSPKGGIRPHNRFSVQSKRSEVLFVDYMAEHLTPTGRAGIIVPEGIIFQSQLAHTQLRKKLVEDYLVAVVSLPAGVFQPYSGVKTSILILDRALARRTDRLAFFKVEHDGYDLGAQRRPIDRNDLPDVQRAVREYLTMTGEAEEAQRSRPIMLDSLVEQGAALIVEKDKLAANGDYNLSAERYRESGIGAHIFPLARIGDLCTINPRKSELADLGSDTRVSFVPMADLSEHRITFRAKKEKFLADVSASYTYFADNDVILARVTPCFENGKAGIARGLLNGIGFGSSEFIVLRCGKDALPEWIYFCVTHPVFRNWAIPQMTGTGGLQRVPRASVADFQIPLPPLAVQQEIVAEIEGYQRVIDGARAVVESYRPQIAVDPEWPLVELGSALRTSSGGTPSRRKNQYYANGAIPWFKSGEVATGILMSSEEYITEDGLKRSSAKIFPAGTVLVAMYGATAGKVGILGIEAAINQAICGILPDNVVIPEFLFYHLIGREKELVKLSLGGAQPNISQAIVRSLSIPIPPLETQQQVVAEIKAEQALVAANRELIERFERKIAAAIGRVWGE